LNRLDDAIVFRSLTKPDLLEILDLEVSKVLTRLKAKQLHLTLERAARDFLVEKGYDPMYGARPMRRAVERYLEDPLAEEILKASLQPNEPITVVVEEGKLAFKQNAPDAPKALSS
jgi:ATP-dependent Clp protease ATP-binding subunit ClpC